MAYDFAANGCTGSRFKAGAAPATVSEREIANRHCGLEPREGGDLESLASPETGPSPRTGDALHGRVAFRYLQPAGTLAA